tara:strand:- start:637 stop:1686 length:1050 start_codon:yes stop_codon:yes gene_type:complete
MAVYTTIDDPSAYFHSQLYTGTGSSHSVTNDANAGNFKPDWVWIKERSSSGGHKIYDSTRGVQEAIQTQSSAAETTTAQGLTAFNTDGFTVGSDGGHNQNSATYVAYQWVAGGGTTASNTDGSITSTVQANTTAGFSIVKFTGTGSTATVGHGLGAIPVMIIQKNLDSSANWSVKHHKTTNNYDFLNLNSSSAATANDSIWTQTDPTTSVFSIGTATAINQSGQDQICYCFAEKQGYSKFGKYVGNGDSNGPFIYTGFKPAFVIVKAAGGTTDWRMNGPDGVFLSANSSAAVYDSAPGPIDRVSNGFKIRGGDDLRASGGTFIYMAWAKNPFVTSTGVPTTAGSTGPAT